MILNKLFVSFLFVLTPSLGLAQSAAPGSPGSSAPTSTSTPAPAPAQGSGNPNILATLDGDRNGLYDDTERKALLDALQKECPELTASGPFDVNGDGKVTILEQSQGRGPFPFLLNKQILENSTKIPWAIDLFPEWLTTAYLQEDIAQGAITDHVPRGTVVVQATQPDPALQPHKSGDRSSVEFAANSGQQFTMPGQRDARWNYRWCLFTFRINAGTGTSDETALLDLNRGNSSNKSSPKIWFSKSSGLHIQYVGQNQGGLDKRIMVAKNVIADGKTWNVVVCGIRYGQMFASVNGVPLTAETRQPPRFSGDWPRETTSYLGDEGKGNMAWAYDALIFGLTEPSEAMVRKMTGWAAHRLGFQAGLPSDHPYRDQVPVLDAEDFAYRYRHDDEKWNAWGKSLTKDVTRVNSGGQRVEPQGFERVFYDDFRANRVKASTSGEGDLWVGPGFNPAVGGDAPLVTPGQQPNVYPHSAAEKKQILSLAGQGGRWRGSAIYTVNDLGHGYTWKGPKVFRIRCMFPQVNQKELAGGLFPAFWSYDPDSIFWRTGNRIEVDWFEFDGKNGAWLNGLSTHYHYPYIKSIFAKNDSKSFKRYKGYSGALTGEKSKIPGGLFFWDGRYHTWEFVVDHDMTYTNVTVQDADGQDKWVEVYRLPTAPTYLERLDLQIDYALKGKNGLPKDGQRQDFVVDWVEVLQKTSTLDAVPAPFTARPSISGSVTAGSTITCQPNLEGIRDIRYYWFADGYPLTYGPDNTFTITEAEAGKVIRCMVKAVGARDMPEAWSNAAR